VSTRANFHVDPKLTSVLGQNYRSTEQAIKELVDNAWDAEATNVWIELPGLVANQPIVVRDDGSGMTSQQVRGEYLVVADDRWSRSGAQTPRLHRRVKGRKGIGKFAGLAAAGEMVVVTKALGRTTTVRITKSDLLSTKADLERIDLPLEVTVCPQQDHGTEVRLHQLNQNLMYPSAERLREILVLEYGREASFTVLVNGESLCHEDIPGRSFSQETALPDAGKVHLKFTIMERKPRRGSGVVVRVGGKVIGRPSFFSLEEHPDIPRKLLERVVGEIEADGLEQDVTADWGAIVENSTAFRQIREWASSQLSQAVESTFAKELGQARARREREIKRRLDLLPEYRREAASKALDVVMRRFYGEQDDKIDAMVSLVLDAFEKDEYWVVCQNVHSADQADVLRFAQAVKAFGLVDMAVMAHQANGRLQLLDELDHLLGNANTLESTMHEALSTNLWVLGNEYSLMSSNKTLRNTVEKTLGKAYRGAAPHSRPDLLLCQNVLGTYLLIEFKRPSHALNRDDQSQVQKYRDELLRYLQDSTIDAMLIGGSVEAGLRSVYEATKLKALAYTDLVSSARTQLQWLMKELATPPNV